MWTFFWKDVWLTNVPLSVLFPRLYSIPSGQELKVGEMWQGSIEGGLWRFLWRKELFEWEILLLQSLNIRLEGVELGEDEDCSLWKP